MTARTAAEQSAWPIEPESLIGRTRLGSAEYRTVVKLLSWLRRVRQKDQAHPLVRPWGVPGICAVIGLLSVLPTAHGLEPGFPLVLGLTVAAIAPLLWRRQRPVLVYAIISAVTLAALPFDETVTGAGAARLVALLNVARFGTPVQLVVCAVFNLATTALSVTFFWRHEQADTLSRGAVLTFLSVMCVLGISLLGMAGRLVDAYIAALEEHAAHLEEDRDQKARLAAATERARISREMHDILGHTLAVIVTLADGASGLARANPQRGADTLGIIADSGRGALGELTRLLAVVDGTPGTETPLAPQPGLADLDDLLERVRAAGPTAALRTEGDLAGLGQGLQLAVYRIVQEALTNTLKYAASDTEVTVTVSATVSATTDGDLVRVTVEDTGPSATAHHRRASRGGGHGLVGMRERVALYGGTLHAGPNTRGGWTVRARLTTGPTHTATAPTTENPLA